MAFAILASSLAKKESYEDVIAVSSALKMSADAETLTSLARLFKSDSILSRHFDEVSLARNVMATKVVDFGDYQSLRNLSGARFARFIEPYQPTVEPAGSFCSSDAGAQCSKLDVACSAKPSWLVFNASRILSLLTDVAHTAGNPFSPVNAKITRFKINKLLEFALPHIHNAGANVSKEQFFPWGFFYFRDGPVRL